MSKQEVFNRARRQVLQFLGLGLAGVTASATIASDRVFAKQFASDGYPVKFPDMIYDSELQMMVDPVSRQPIHVDKKVATINAKITACKGAPNDPNCTPQCDDNCG